jgi:hypothetical protein
VLTLLLLAALQQPQAAAAEAGVPGAGAPRVVIPRIEGAAAESLTVDGNLDESVWATAARLTGFHQYRPSDGRPAEERTEVLVWYSPRAVHVGILAYDSDPGAIRATVADRDNLGNEDRVALFFDTFNDRRRAYFFAVNPLGAQADGVRSEGTGSAGNLFGASDDFNPDYSWESKGRRTPDGYVVELRIPFSSLRFPGSGEQVWGFNVSRITQRTGYEDTWTDVRRANASFLTQSGSLAGLRGLDRGLVVEAQPFLTTSWRAERDGSGAFRREDPDPNVGVNLKLGFTKLALDATVNPDFSTVESDVGLVTVNERFALFIPEKRPFFLEGIELFSTPQQLVYTRRIVDPVVGAKLTGKFGRLGVAYLAAVDGTDQGNAVFNVLRLRGDVGSNSLAGVTVTDRSEGSSYNRVASADARIVFARLYFVEAQAGGSWTADAGTTRSGPLWKLEFDRTGRAWGFNYQVNGISPDFSSAAGFVNRTDVVSARAFNRLTWYGAPGAALENFTTFFGLNRLWDYSGFDAGDALEGEDEVNFNTTWRGGWQLNGSVGREFYDFDPAFYAGYQVDAPGGPLPFAPAAGVDGLWRGSIEAQTPTFRHWEADAGVEAGAVPLFDEATEGRGFEAEAEVEVRPVPSLRASASAVYARLERRDGSEFARAVIPRVGIQYQPTRALFFRVITEYRTERRSALRDPVGGEPLLVDGVVADREEDNGLRTDWLVAYEPVPGTAAFLGYGATLDGGDPFDFGGLQRREDGFFLKLSYLFRP